MSPEMDLGLMLLVALAGCAACYALVVRKVRQIVTARDLTIADELGALDAAIQALETRLAEQKLISLAGRTQSAAVPGAEANERETEFDPESKAEVTGEIKAVIAAAAIAALGEKAAVRSVRSVPGASPWSQQGRAMVQGSHNARARR